MADELLSRDFSFDEIIEKYADTVFRICFIFMKNNTDAEDVFQNVFLKLYELQPTFNDADHIRAWLITVARNECKNQLRSFWRRNVTCIDEVLLPEKTAKNSEIIGSVLRLPLRYRDILYLFYFEDYKISELSAMLKMKESTVKTRLKRGRNLLKDELLKEGYDNV